MRPGRFSEESRSANDLELLTFVMAGGIALAIALMTVGHRALKAAVVIQAGL